MLYHIPHDVRIATAVYKSTLLPVLHVSSSQNNLLSLAIASLDHYQLFPVKDIMRLLQDDENIVMGVTQWGL
jgi:hypothetical protein